MQFTKLKISTKSIEIQSLNYLSNQNKTSYGTKPQQFHDEIHNTLNIERHKVNKRPSRGLKDNHDPIYKIRTTTRTKNTRSQWDSNPRPLDPESNAISTPLCDLISCISISILNISWHALTVKFKKNAKPYDLYRIHKKHSLQFQGINQKHKQEFLIMIIIYGF